MMYNRGVFAMLRVLPVVWCLPVVTYISVFVWDHWQVTMTVATLMVHLLLLLELFVSMPEPL